MPKGSQRQDGFREIWKRLKKNKMAMVSLFVLIAIFILAALAPVLAPYPYEVQDKKHALEGSTAAHLLGTDRLGRDILSRLLYGAFYSLAMGIISTAVASGIGIVLGSIAGYYGNRIDNLIMRLLDVYQGIPMMLSRWRPFLVQA
jgi:peptide/nickel transport system permease protein